MCCTTCFFPSAALFEILVHTVAHAHSETRWKWEHCQNVQSAFCTNFITRASQMNRVRRRTYISDAWKIFVHFESWINENLLVVYLLSSLHIAVSHFACSCLIWCSFSTSKCISEWMGIEECGQYISDRNGGNSWRSKLNVGCIWNDIYWIVGKEGAQRNTEQVFVDEYRHHQRLRIDDSTVFIRRRLSTLFVRPPAILLTLISLRSFVVFSLSFCLMLLRSIIFTFHLYSVYVWQPAVQSSYLL